ncbi:MAG: response regulator [bacterium]|nr:response regulator [bacterium]
MCKAKILIVDDDKEVLYSFERALTADGYDITAVDNGSEALDCIRNNEYNVVLTDIVMPEINGVRILEETNRVSPETKVILITGYGSIDTSVEALRKNASDYIVKPCDKEELRIRIKSAIEKQQLEKELVKAKIYKKTLESLGAVAHEINNPLTAILGNIEMILTEMPEDHELYRQINIIGEAAERVAVIVKKMRKVRKLETKPYTKHFKILDFDKSARKSKYSTEAILIVDDEPILTELFKMVLIREGYDTDTADSGLTALEMLKVKDYSVIILDVSMPQIDGYETLRRMKKFYTEIDKDLPAVIMITGYDVEDILDKCKKLGAFATLHKPLGNEVLLDTVKSAEDYFKSTNC